MVQYHIYLAVKDLFVVDQLLVWEEEMTLKRASSWLIAAIAVAIAIAIARGLLLCHERAPTLSH